MAELKNGLIDVVSRDDGKLLSQVTTGASRTVMLEQPSLVKINGTREMVASFERQGNDLILHMRDGSVMRYQQFFFDDVDGDHSELVFDDGKTPPQHALFPVTNEFADAQVLLSATPEYESLGSLEPLLLASSGVSGNVVAAAGIGGLGLVGLAARALSGGSGGGDNNNAGNGTSPAASTIAINSPGGDGYLNAGEAQLPLTLSGTTTNIPAGTALTVTLAGSTLQTTVSEDGSWSVTIPASSAAQLPQGVNPITVTATSGDGPVIQNSPPSSLTVMTQLPSAAIDTPFGDAVLSGPETRVSQSLSGRTGITVAGQTVTVNVGGVDLSATVSGDGSWQITLPPSLLQSLPQGNNALTVSVTDPAGNRTTQTTPVNVITTPPDLTVVLPETALNSSTMRQPFFISGQSAEGAKVTVTLNDKTYTASAGTDGSWQIIVPVADLQTIGDGSYPVTVTASDAYGNLTTQSEALTIDITPPAVTLNPIADDGYLNSIEHQQSLTLEGTAEQGAGIVMTLNGVAYNATADLRGNWQITVPADIVKQLPDGRYTVSVQATDSAGNVATNTQPLEIATAQPVIVLAPLTNDNLLDGAEKQLAQIVSGTVSGVEAGQSVTVTFNNATYNGTVNGDGRWSATIPAGAFSGLENGTQNYSVTISDKAGNTATADGSFTVDNSFSAISIGIISGDNMLNAAEAQRDLSINGSSRFVASGAQVAVRFNGEQYLTAIDSEGTWQVVVPASALAGLANSELAVSATATDVDGNVVTVTRNLVSAVNPDFALSVAQPFNDGALNGIEVATAQTLTGKTGVAGNGQLVSVEMNGNRWQGIVDAEGNWSVSLPASALQNLPQGRVPFNVDVSDAAGNSATLASSVVVDTQPPLLSLETIAGDNRVSLAEAEQPVVIFGSGTAGDEVTVSLIDKDYRVSVADDGSWRIAIPPQTFSALSDGDYRVVVSATDAAGNVTSLTRVITLDRTPSTVTINALSDDGYLNASEAANDLAVTGSSVNVASGSTITFALGNQRYTATVNTDGSWSVTIPSADLQKLPEGPQQARATVNGTDINDESTLDVYITRVPVPVIDSPFGDGILNISESRQIQTLKGATGVQGGDQEVTVSMGGKSRTANVDEKGNWSLTLDPATLQTLEEGTQPIEVTVRDARGNSGTVASSVLVDRRAPELQINEIAGDNTLNASEIKQPLSVRGSASAEDAGQTVSLVFNGETYQQKVLSDGSWQFDLPASATQNLADGDYTVAVTLADRAGNSSRQDSTLSVAASPASMPAISIDPVSQNDYINRAEAGNDLLISGSSSAGEGRSVTVTLNGESWSAVIQSDGRWRVTVPAASVGALSDGAQSISAEVSNAAGNAASLTHSVTVIAREENQPTIAIDPVTQDDSINYQESRDDVAITGHSQRLAPGSTVVVVLNEKTYQTTADNAGNWQVTVPANDVQALQQGSNTLTATGSDVAGNPATASETFTVDTRAPLLDVNLSAGDTLNLAEALAGLTVSGATEAGLSVSVTLNDKSWRVVADQDGSWRVPISSGDLQRLADGVTPVTVTVSDASGNISSKTVDLNVAINQLPQLTLETPFGDGMLNASEAAKVQAISGQSTHLTEGTTVTVTIGEATFSGTVDATGQWRIALPAGALNDLADGAVPLSVTASDAAGNAASVATRVTLAVKNLPEPTIDKPFGDGLLNALEASETQRITGSTGITGTGQTVTLRIANLTTSATVDAQGNWQSTLTPKQLADITDGKHTLVVTASDQAGNSSSASLDFTSIINELPAPTLNTPFIDGVLNAAEAAAGGELKGTTGIIGAQTVSVNLNGTRYQASVNSDSGEWRLALSASTLDGLPDGRWPVAVDVTDAVGNVATLRSVLQVDIHALPNVSVTLPFGDGVLNATEVLTSQVISGNTGKAGAGQTVTVQIDPGITANATVNDSGDWSLTLSPEQLGTLENGTHQLTVLATDRAGNQSERVLDFTAQLTLPVPTIAPPFGDDVLNISEMNAPVVFTGTTGINGSGQRITLHIDDDGIPWSGTVDDSGTWTVTLPGGALGALDKGTHTVFVTVTDSAGNSGSKNLDFTASLSAPQPTLDLPFNDSFLNGAEAAAGASLSGSAGGAQQVAVTLNGVTYNATIANGNWLLPLTSGILSRLAQGEQSITVIATDASGNATRLDSGFTVDTRAPAITITPFTGDNTLSYLESQTTQMLSGTTTGVRAGQEVTVAMGQTTLSTVIKADGGWSLNVTPEAMAQLGTGGTGQITATIADVAGNIGTAAASVALNLTPPQKPLLTLAPVSDNNIVNASDGQTLAFSGTFANLRATDGLVSGSVTVSINGTALPASATVDSTSGTWRLTVSNASLPEGTLTVEAKLTTVQGDNLNVSGQILVDRVPPILTINTVSGNDLLNADEAAAGLAIGGTASVSESGRPLTLSLNDKTYTAIVQADGRWSVKVSPGDLQVLAQGNQTLSAVLVDAAGNSTGAERKFIVDTIAPQLEVDAFPGGNLLNAADVAIAQVITGRAKGAEGQTVALYLGDSDPLATATVNADGTFRINLTPQVLASLNDGALVFGVQVSDRAGNQSEATITVNKAVNSALDLNVDPLFGDGFLNAAEATVAQTITGVATSAGSGATVSLTLGGTTLSTTVGQDGHYTLRVPPSLLGQINSGDDTLNLVLTDAAGNTRTLSSPFTAILTPPVFSALNGLFGGDNRINVAEAAVAQTVSGKVSAVSGSTVTLTLGKKTWQTQVDTNGAWGVTLQPADIAALANGTLVLGVKVVDPAGNTASSAVNVGIFTVPPVINLAPVFGDGILNIKESQVAQTISGTVSNAAAGSVVNLSLGSSVIKATVGQSGAFSASVSPDILATLTNGTLTVAASLTDAAGNVARASATATVKVTAPTIAIDTLFGDGRLNALDAQSGQAISGTISGTDAGTNVTVTVGGSQFVTTTAANGTFNLALPPAILQTLSDGSLTVNISVTDMAGNVASRSAMAAVGIHALPTITLNPLFGDGVLSLAEALVTQTVSGTVANAAAGSVVKITMGNTALTATVNSDGTFRAQLTPSLLNTLLDGNLTASASVTDAVGNIASFSTGVQVGIHAMPTLSMNSIFGDGVLSVSDLNSAQIISGTSNNVAAGTAITVTLAGKNYTTTVNSSGGWSLSVAKTDLAALVNGSQTVNASVTDAYGNVASTSSTLNVTAQTPPTLSIGSLFGDNLLSAVDVQSAQVINGTATSAEGATLTVRVGSSSLTTTVAADGTWSISVPGALLSTLPDGVDTITATLTNAAGRVTSSSATVQAITHTLPTVTLTASTLFGGDHYLNLSETNAAKTLSGTATNAAGSKVVVTVADASYSTTVSSTGTWSVSIPSSALKAITDGSHTATVTVTDAVGNVATASDSFTAVTHFLPAIGVDPILSLVGVLLTGLTVTGGTVNLAQGTRLAVTLNGITQQATTDALGRYSTKFAGNLLTVLNLNSVVTVTAVDAAGNPATTSNTLLLGSLLPVVTSNMLMAVAADDGTHALTANAHSDASAVAVQVPQANSSMQVSAPEQTTTPGEDAIQDKGFTIGGLSIALADGHHATGETVTGGRGSDTIMINAAHFHAIDGGAGKDTLVINGENMALDLTTLGMKVTHVEVIDLGKSGNNSVKLDLNKALNITDVQSDDLVIKGNSGGQVTLENDQDGVWAAVGRRTVEGQSYDIYHNSALATSNTLGDVLIQHNLQVHII